MALIIFAARPIPHRANSYRRERQLNAFIERLSICVIIGRKEAMSQRAGCRCPDICDVSGKALEVSARRRNLAFELFCGLRERCLARWKRPFACLGFLFSYFWGVGVGGIRTRFLCSHFLSFVFCFCWLYLLFWFCLLTFLFMWLSLCFWFSFIRWYYYFFFLLPPFMLFLSSLVLISFGIFPMQFPFSFFSLITALSLHRPPLSLLLNHRHYHPIITLSSLLSSQNRFPPSPQHHHPLHNHHQFLPPPHPPPPPRPPPSPLAIKDRPRKRRSSPHSPGTELHLLQLR